MTHLPEFTIVERNMVPHILKNRAYGSQVRWVISIGSPEDKPPAGFADRSLASKLRLEFNDVTYHRPWAGYQAPQEDDIRRLVAFGERAKDGRVLVHCAAGVSRSSAAALILLAMRHGMGNEMAAMEQLLADTKTATGLKLRNHEMITPNRRMVWLADQVLERGGALYEALLLNLGFMYWTKYEPGQD